MRASDLSIHGDGEVRILLLQCDLDVLRASRHGGCINGDRVPPAADGKVSSHTVWQRNLLSMRSSGRPAANSSVVPNVTSWRTAQMVPVDPPPGADPTPQAHHAPEASVGIAMVEPTGEPAFSTRFILPESRIWDGANGRWNLDLLVVVRSAHDGASGNRSLMCPRKMVANKPCSW